MALSIIQLLLLYLTLVTPHKLRDSAFSSITRRRLLQCNDPSPFLNMTLDTQGPLANVQTVVVNVTGVVQPSSQDWIGVFTSASHNYSDCATNKALYVQTGDTSSLPLLCDYPLKFKFLKDDPGYLNCSKKTCRDRFCAVKTCSASLSFRLINIRTDITFVLFSGGLTLPCILKTSKPLGFSTPAAPLYGHLAVADSLASSMRLTWISGDPTFVVQLVQYAGFRFAVAKVESFTRDEMCDGIPAPAKTFGWHNPGYIYTALMEGLAPSTTYTYRYGSQLVGWSDTKTFKTPPARGGDKLRFAVYGDMGKADRDSSLEHYIQPGSLQVIDAVAKDDLDVIFHIGDLSYATGFLAEWDQFLEMIEPVASKVPYMTAIGNHERDFPRSSSVYNTPDSGGECGVPYQAYFHMPTSKRSSLFSPVSNSTDKPWYSIELGPVHFTVISTEHNWTSDSEQYEWMKKDMSSVDRVRTPWLVFTGHRPMYSTQDGNGIVSKLLTGVDASFAPAVEPLLKLNKVDLVIWGHVHNYERTCGVYQGSCLHYPSKDDSGGAGIDVYNSTAYTAPIHVVVGMAGFSLDGFVDKVKPWSLVRISEYGYGRVNAQKHELLFELVSVQTQSVADSFKIIK